MIRSGENTLFPLVHDYLKIYLPKQRNVSHNTVRSYRKALEELLDYIKEHEQIPLGQITFEHLTANAILSFLEYLETEKGCSVSTRNARFAALRAFMDYAADHDVTLIAGLNKLKKIPFKKPDNTAVAVEYMSMAAITAIIEQPDATTSKGLRDRFFMILLYDTGARVQEMLNIRLSDIQLGPLPNVTLFGKGRKTRIVPLMEKTPQHLKKYLLEFHADNASEEDVTLFYSVIRGEKHPLTSRTVQYILQKYGRRDKFAKISLPMSTRTCSATAEQCTSTRKEWT